ncbi:MAG: hypothetical protein ABI682_00765 [Acidobacteriota bacterium]
MDEAARLVKQYGRRFVPVVTDEATSELSAMPASRQTGTWA